MTLKKYYPSFVTLLCTLAASYCTAQVAPTPSAYTILSKVNYVREWDATAPITDPATLITRSVSDVKQTTQYFDGLGRPLQTVVKQISPSGKDLVTPVVYDDFGREVYKYLPFISNAAQTGDITNDGIFKMDPFQQQAAFATGQYPGQHYFYGQTAFESSPLNRVLNTYAPGDSWVGGPKGVGMLYLDNLFSDSVEIWNIDTLPGSKPVSAGIYPSGKLYKTVTTDEQGHSVIEFKDKEGHVILKRVQLWDSPATGHSGWLNTYYVYDYLDNLRYVMQPKTVEWLLSNGWSFSGTGGNTVSNELCFRYEYDHRKRMIIKKVPGAAETWMIYDARDRLVMSQDGHQRSSNQWVFTKYDSQNRNILTGLYTDLTHTSQSSMQAYLNTQGLALYEIYNPATSRFYTLTNSFPVVTDSTTVQQYIFYDDYAWARYFGFTSVKANYYDNLFPAVSSSYPYPQALTQNKQTHGVHTGTWNRGGTLTESFYDDRGRVIQHLDYNKSNGTDSTTIQYSFSGQPLQTILVHQKKGANPQLHTVTTKINYDSAGRLLTISKAINSVIGGQTFTKAPQIIVTNTYDELGQLQNKNLGSLDNLNYAYNIRGWLTEINKDYLGSSTGNYFGMELGYDQAAGAAGATYQGLQYNGNIAGTIWKSAGDGVGRKYDFSYDNVNRLTGASYHQSGNSWTDNTTMDFSVSNLFYDANGNIGGMNQKGFVIGSPAATIDQLTYTYQSTSNKLSGVVDGMNDQNSKLGDFHYNPTTKGTTDYGYDSSGNLITDKNKGIGGTNYNYLNLPEVISFGAKGSIQWIYDAAGQKLQKIVTDKTGSSTKITNTVYIPPFVYVNDTLQFMEIEEGRARLAFHKYLNDTTRYGWEYDFFEKDHLGNTRVILSQEKDTARYVATMETAYRAKENALFYNIDSTAWPITSIPGVYPTDGTTNPNAYVARVNGSGHKMGPAILLKVMSGDSVVFGVKSFYKSGGAVGTPNSSLQDVLNSLAGGLMSVTGGAHGSISTTSTPGNPVYAALNSFLPTNDPPTTTKPKAYLNWMLLDNQFNYVSANGQSGAAQVGAADVLNSLANTFKLKQSGYLYIWVSNETPNWDAFFDNLCVVMYNGPMLEENHYYPFGLAMSGISDKALKTNYAENKYRYNGGNELQNKEFSDGSGLELYDAVNRMYDPQLGRFWQIDEFGEVTNNWSPYAFSTDNPIEFNDPFGLDTLTRKTNLDPVYVTATHSTQNLQNTYWDLTNRGVSFDNVKDKGLRNWLNNYDNQQKYIQKVHSDIRTQGIITANIASIFIPVGEIAQLARLGELVQLYRLKRGLAEVEVGSALIKSGLNISEHAAQRLAERGITKDMLEVGISKGAKFFDPKNGTINYVLKGGFASGKDLLIGTNPLTGRVATAIRGSDLINSRFIPLQ